MKTLLLMRHAKSSFKDEHLKDRERPLSKRGIRQATAMGELIMDRELVPQLLLSSTVVRACQTAQIVSQACQFRGREILLENLFMAEPAVLLDMLKLISDDNERVLIIGHNPGMEGLLQRLTGRVEALGTAAVAYLVLPIRSWREISHDSIAELVELWEPRMLDQ